MRAIWMLTLSLFAGCTSFESGALPHVERWPPSTSAGRAALTVSLAGLPEKFAAGWRAALTRTLSESRGLSFAVEPARGAAGRSLAIQVAHRRQPLPVSRAWMAACAFSGGVIPARALHAFDLRAVVRDEAGRELGVIARQVESATWIGWLFLPVMPFAGVGMTGLAEDTFRSILGEAVARGLL
jgi:hypothetical protein